MLDAFSQNFKKVTTEFIEEKKNKPDWTVVIPKHEIMRVENDVSTKVGEILEPVKDKTDTFIRKVEHCQNDVGIL